MPPWRRHWAKTDKPARLCIATPEGLGADGHLITATLQHAVGHDIPLFGALAGDQWRVKGTKQFYGTDVLTDSIPVLLLAGDFQLLIRRRHRVAPGRRSGMLPGSGSARA